MEEYARFVLDDAILCGEIKKTRHALAATVPEKFASALCMSREITGDVGRDVKTEAEYRRDSPVDVALAAGKRLSEALRAIEEYGKTIDPTFATGIERIRYTGYELERRLAMHTRARERFGAVRLYVIITESLCKGDWLATAQSALRGGADCLQLREKGLSDTQLLVRARRLADLCREHGALFVVNDRPDLAVLSRADGVHVGQGDLGVAQTRRIIGADLLVGVSTHTPEQLSAAAVDVPDYIAVGPIFSTTTKPQSDSVGPALLQEARSRTSIPLVAIGGIDDSNAGEVLAAAAGDCCLCVCSGIISQPDVEAATIRLRALVDREGSTGSTRC